MGKKYAAAAGVLRAVFALAAIAATLMWGRMAHADDVHGQLIELNIPTISTTYNASTSDVTEMVMSADVPGRG